MIARPWDACQPAISILGHETYHRREAFRLYQIIDMGMSGMETLLICDRDPALPGRDSGKGQQLERLAKFCQQFQSKIAENCVGGCWRELLFGGRHGGRRRELPRQ